MIFDSDVKSQDGIDVSNDNEKIEISTYPVPLPFKEIIDSISFSTEIPLNYSKKQIIDKAIKLHIEGNIKEAKNYYIYCLENGFNDPTVFSNYGIILRDIGRLYEAEKYTREAIKNKPDFAEAYLNLGNILNDIGDFEEAEKYIRKAIKLKPSYITAYSNLGDILSANGKLNEAESVARKAIKLGSDFNSFLSLSNILKKLEKFEEAEKYIRKAIEMNPDDAIAHNNLGVILKDTNKLEEARLITSKAIGMDPENAMIHNNLGAILKDIGSLEEAEKAARNAIKYEPTFAEAFLNLGNIKNQLGNSKEAEFYTRKSILLKPDSAIAHNNLASILNDLGRLDEAEESIHQALKINPDLAISFQNLSLILHKQNKFKTSIECIKKALNIDPESKDIKLLFNIFQARYNEDRNQFSIKENSDDNSMSAFLNPIVLYRKVEKELVNSLYNIKSLDLNRFNDPTFGNARGSDYQLFEDNYQITNKLKVDLLNLTKNLLNKDVFFHDSFFTILEGESMIKKHNHLVDIDKQNGLNIYKQKYSLVYYLSVGDQKCTNPGILKFYDPNEEILPEKGMIIVFPADRYHSVIYDGKKDRVIVGVNFYRL